MRHRKAARKLSRTSAHRRALYSNLVAALVRCERIETTLAKAKELRGVADRTINWGVSVSDLYQRGLENLSQEERARIVHAKRMARRVLKDTEVLQKLFQDVAPRYVGRPGGYTRVLKTRNRRGDAAPMAFIELCPAAAPARAEKPAADKGASEETAEKAKAKPKAKAKAKAAEE